MYITPEKLEESIARLRGSHQKVNSFIGLVALLIHGEELKGDYWKSDMVGFASHLDKVLYINDNKQKRVGEKFWFTLFQSNWIERVFELILKGNKISIQDCAAVLMWDRSFENMDDLIESFIAEIGCQDFVSSCFDFEKTEQLTSTTACTTDDLKKVFNINSSICTLGLDGNLPLLTKPAGDLSGAPYSQTLYAGTSFRQAFTIFDFDFLDEYKLTPPQKNKYKKTTTTNFDIDSFIKSLADSKLIFYNSLPLRFTAALQTKPFVILTGLSGSGKRKLAEAFSLWMCESPQQYCMVAVGADWTNREPLLGFPNALEEGRYIKPDSGVLDLILGAVANPDRPYFLILDEMNMSHVERYFADFLSAMESNDSHITLHPEGSQWDGCDVPATLSLPENLFVIGTVNIDETTYMFSPKVLDRANVIEFRVSEDEMAGYFESPKPVDMEQLRGHGASMAESFVGGASNNAQFAEKLGETLMPFFNKLQGVGAEFGYRTASEISQFVAICTRLSESTMSFDEVLDAAIIQKLLPKLHGSRNKIEKVLQALGCLCLNDSAQEPFQSNGADSIKYPLSYEKLQRMHKRVIADGFTSFAEA